MVAEPLENEIDALFKEWDNKESPGCAIGIIKNGEYVYKKGFGMANLEHDIPITPETVFRIGSVSKQFTAFCIALLARESKLNLDVDIRKYIPEIPEYKKVITIRNLIHHTSGIRDVYELWGMKGLKMKDFDPLDYEDILTLLSRQKNLDFASGKSYAYSNSGYILLTIILNRITRKSISQYAEEKMFKPLGMRNTHFHEDCSLIVKHRATGYSKNPDGTWKIEESYMQVAGDGAIFTTLEDFKYWDDNYYEPIVGDKGFIDLITTPGLLNNGKLVQSDGGAYAFGLVIGEHKGLKTISHGGAWAGFRAHMLRFPELKASIVCFSNHAEFMPENIVVKVANLFLKEKFKQQKEEEDTEDLDDYKEIPVMDLPIADLEKFTGIYHSEKLGVNINAYVKKHTIELDVNDGMFNFTLAPISNSKFKSIQGSFFLTCEFQPTTENTFNVITQLPKPYGVQEFIGLKSIIYEKNLLNQFEGEFYSEELDCIYLLTAKEDLLSLVLKKRKPEPLFSVKKNKFWASKLGVSLEFKDQHENSFNTFLVSGARAQKIQFKRN